MVDSLKLLKIAESTKKLSSLVVEDDLQTNELLCTQLTSFFSKVYSKTDAKKALELYKKHRPDIVFIDLIMPDIDGIELSKQIKLINKDQIIIIISASNDFEKLRQSFGIGISDFIHKPLNYEKMLSMFENILRFIKDNKKLKTKTFSVSLPLELYDITCDSAKEESISKNAIIIRALKDHFKIS